MNETYAFIEAEKTTHDVAFLCRLLNVARPSPCAWRSAAKARAARQAADAALAHEISVLHIASRNTYGVPRIHADCGARGGGSTTSVSSESCARTADGGQ